MKRTLSHAFSKYKKKIKKYAYEKKYLKRFTYCFDLMWCVKQKIVFKVLGDNPNITV
jgi:hypothetical protein